MGFLIGVLSMSAFRQASPTSRASAAPLRHRGGADAAAGVVLAGGGAAQFDAAASAASKSACVLVRCANQTPTQTNHEGGLKTG